MGLFSRMAQSNVVHAQGELHKPTTQKKTRFPLNKCLISIPVRGAPAERLFISVCDLILLNNGRILGFAPTFFFRYMQITGPMWSQDSKRLRLD